MRHLISLLCALFAFSLSSEARAEKRVALVIGNGAYQNTTKLTNPGNDAADMSAALQRLNFDVVDGRDLDKREMERLIRQFGIKLAGADVALFFYAGHGLQVGGQNYLVPTDAKMASEGDIDFESLPLALVMKQMEREAKTSLVLLDACRDNPLARNLARKMGTRSTQIGQGLAEVQTGVGTLIGFSTQPGSVALDGTGRNSPYTEALLKHIESSGADVSSVLIDVRLDVLKTTSGKQVPWEHTSLTGQVYLKSPPAGTTASIAEPPKAPVGKGIDADLEIALWNSVKDTKSPAVLQVYLDRYPNGTFAGLARVMLEQLKTAPKPPEQVRLAGVPDAKAEAEQKLALTRSLQTELKRVGCYTGSVDGAWGDMTSAALGNFSRQAKLPLAVDQPSSVALDAVRSREGRVCALECGEGTAEVKGKCVAVATNKSRKAKSTTYTERKPKTNTGTGSSTGPKVILGIGNKGRIGVGIGF